MTISETTPALAPERLLLRKDDATPAIIAGCLLTLGHLPLVLLQGRLLWDRPHYQAFPVAVVGSLVLIKMATRKLGPLAPGRPRVTYPLVGLCWSLLFLAGLTAWPWLGMLAAMATLLTLGYGLGGWRLVRALLPGWVFACLALLPPSGADLNLISRLQSLVTHWGSPVLDVLGVYHVTEGNVINLGSQRLFVEEACSGIQSLFAVLGGTLFFVLWTRPRWYRAIFLGLAALIWVLVGNTARVVAVAFAQARWGMDVSHGWKHEVLGLFIFVAVLGLTISADQFLRFLSALTKVRWSEPVVLTARAAAVAAVAAEPETTATPTRPTKLPDVRRTWLASRSIGAAFGVLGVLQIVWLWPSLAEAFSADPVVARLEALGQDDLPERWGALQRSEFQVERRERGDVLGEFSKIWRYTSPKGTILISADYPFRGWHELTACYQAIGWSISRRAEAPSGRSIGAGPFIEADFNQPPNRFASLFFGLDRLDGTALEPRPSRNLFEYLGNRLSLLRPGGGIAGRMAPGYMSMPPCYQFQLWVETDTPLTDAERADLVSVFDQARQALRSKLAGPKQAATKGGPS